MNYFTHGMRFIDRPYFLVGTALPDLLSVVDRQVRMRSRRVAPFADGSGSPQAEIAAGVLQHLNDDAWFHNTPAFTDVTGQLTRLFRELQPPDEGFRPALLGHIVMELILDGVLIRRNPAILDAYYAAFSRPDAELVQDAVNQMARVGTQRLAMWLPAFVRERFLADYLQPDRLLYRLNQVMQRVKLNQLPTGTEAVLNACWSIVEQNIAALLPGFDLIPPFPLKDDAHEVWIEPAAVDDRRGRDVPPAARED